MHSIEPWLRSEETGEPFTHCVSCKLPLLEIDAPWLVNKDFHLQECTLEYAICQPCREHISEQLSEESKKSVREFLESHIPWQDRIAEFMKHPDPASRFNRCIVCETPRDAVDNYAISALLDASGELVIGPLPLMICHQCVDQMTANLSDHSRAVWKRFIEDHFPGPTDTNHFPGML